MKSEQQNVVLKGIPNTWLKTLIQQRKTVDIQTVG